MTDFNPGGMWPHEYFSRYVSILHNVANSVNISSIRAAYDLLKTHMEDVVIFGNGGSAAIADHFCCDFVKGLRTDTDLKPKCVSLVSNGPLTTALANDSSYDMIFSEQIGYHRPRLAIAVSSSGNSKNVINGLIAAKYYGAKTIALVGFDGGDVLKRKHADEIIHVNSNNYGIVEDVHMMLLHSFVQNLRLTFSNKKNIQL
jgi:D-sedoheptulose 7-phosphate isomerase